MPLADNKVDRDRSENMTADALVERREAVVMAMKTARETGHAEERARERAAQTAMMANRSPADRVAAESTLAAQRERVEMRQRGGLELINAALDAASRVEQRGAEGQRQAKAMLDQAADAQGAIAARDGALLKAEREMLANALAQTDDKARATELQRIEHAQQDATELVARDLAVANAEVERREALASITLTNEQREQLQSAVLDAAKNERLRDLVNPRMVQDLVNEALCPGKQVAADVNEQAAVDRVKGLIAEQLAIANLRDEVDAENKLRKDRHLFVIEGDRIRDEQRAKITDGVAVWRDQENRLHLWKALEVKGGRSAARDLVYKLEKLSDAQDRELRKYADDLARDQLKKDATVAERELRSREVQKTTGQRAQTTERLDIGERLYIDGKTEAIAVDRSQRLSDLVRSVTVDDALKQHADVQRLGVLTQDLDAVAKAFVDELVRRRATV